jgi:PASTA domain
VKLARVQAAYRLGCLAALTLVAYAAIAGAYEKPASAQILADPDYWKGTQERRETVYAFVYGESPRPIPSAYDDVREAEELIDQHQLVLPPTNPKAPPLWQQIRTLTVRTALSSPLGALGTVTLAGGAATIGVLIGSGIYAKFIELKVPPPAPWNPDAAQKMVFRTKGSSLYTGLTVPYDGWVWHWWVPSLRIWKNFWVTPVGSGTELGCPSAGNPPSVPQGFSEVIGAPHPNCGSGGAADGGVAHAGILPENALGAAGPIEDYTNQPFDQQTWPGTPPAQSTVEESIDTELEKPENKLLRDWLNYELGSPGEPDPFSGAVNMPDCAGATVDACTAELTRLGITDYQVQTLPESNLSFANGEVVTTDPQPGTSIDPGTVTATVAANPATRVKSREDSRCDRDTYSAPGDPGPAPADGTAYPQFQAAPTPWNGPYAGFDPGTTPWQPVNLLMRYGLQPGNINRGWGWRHIKAKHGYGATEMSETAQALATDPAPTTMWAATRQYAFHLYYEMPDGPGTIWCVRTALIELEPDKNQLKMGNDSPKGVINSYTGLLLGAAAP